MIRVLWLLLGGVVGFVLASAAITALDHYSPRSARVGATSPDSPDRFLATALAAGGEKVDLAGLYEGDWDWVCLFGAESRPINFLRNELARRKQTEPSPLDERVTRGFLAGGNENGVLGPEEGAISVLDWRGYLSIVRLRGLSPVVRLKGPVCTDRDMPVVDLAGK